MKTNSVGIYWLLLLAILSVSCSQLSLAQDADVDAKEVNALSKKVLRTVDKIVPTIRHRNENEFLELCMPLIKSSTPEQLKAIDVMCLDRGVTTVSEWFKELVVGKALQGFSPVRAIKNRQMTRVVLFGVADDLEDYH